MKPLKVWSRFTKAKDGTEIKCRIQEVSGDYEKELYDFDLFVKYFLPDEPMNQAVGIPDNVLAVNEFKEEMLKNFLLDENSMIDVCLVEDGPNEEVIAGASIMYLAKKSDPILDPNQLEIKTEEMNRLFSILTEIENTYDIFEGLKEDSYFSGKGMVVDPKYRGLGIAGEFLKARVAACKEYNVPLTAAWMTSIGTQKAASKVGWKVAKEIEVEELGKQAGISLKGGPTTHCKLMYARK